MKLRIRKLLRWAAMVWGVVMVMVIAAAGLLWWSLRASLAQLTGRHELPGLVSQVRVERDSLGVPSIFATNRLDATRALGFLHAQERFFQMDLSRRAGAGELSELFGPILLSNDLEQRIHRPRALAKRALESASIEELVLVKAYADGINAGLAALKVRPPEYLALRRAPTPWHPEDTYLVAYAMFGNLHDVDGDDDYRESVLQKAFSPGALAFLNSPDATWSAALDGSELTAPPIPSAQDFNVRADRGHAQSSGGASHELEERSVIGSNNWAVDGKRSGTGSAIVANDMHLGLDVPNTWYRARLIYHDPELGQQDVIGVTLPGAPVVVSGSNRHVAWGNTASELDISDLVELEFDSSNPRRYRTPSGWRDVQMATEVIKVRNGTNVTFAVEETIWGPIITKGNTRYALACTMHDPGAVNMGLLQVERARNVENALSAACVSGTPVNNFLVGDSEGHIGYSLLGRLPNRVGFDGMTPCSWSDGTKKWEGWLPPEKYPRVMNPAEGILWTANNRTLGSPEYNILHTSADHGARARQIRDDLRAMDHADEQALWTIYRDDRALFLERWQKLMLNVLLPCSATNADWQLTKQLVSSWGARAATNSQGFRLVRAFRNEVLALLFEPPNQHLADLNVPVRVSNEQAGWAMLQQKADHLLAPKFRSYDELLHEAVNRLLADLSRQHIALTNATWGARNELGIRHPLSHAVPALARWLDMPKVQVSGDSYMPKVHHPGSGVSERMVVSPGHEERALFNMPCGQSGHFLSPFYRSEMQAWLNIEPQPFLPGPMKYDLVLAPGGR